MSVSPSEAFNAIGNSHTVTFTCGNFASTLTGPSSSPYPATGCFDVRATIVDVTTGEQLPADSMSCAGQPASLASQDCTTVANPICASGFRFSNTTQQCQPCPAGFTYVPSGPVGAQCHTAPINGVCPPGTQRVPPNGPGGPVDCTEGLLPTTPTPSNQVTLTFTSGSPHVFRIDFSGYVGTTAAGTCQAGTQPANANVAVDYGRTNGPPPPLMRPACQFVISAYKKYVEGTKLEVIPTGACGGTIEPNLAGLFGGTPCFFIVRATGQTTVKLNVNCNDGSEPANGTPAPGFSDEVDPEFGTEGVDDGGLTPLVPQYSCSNNTLFVVNLPVPNIPVDLSATNATFSPRCIPADRLPPPTPTPVTSTPTPTSTATSTPTPPPGPTVTATPFPNNLGFTNAALCTPHGGSTTRVTTNEDGLAGVVGGTATVTAYAQATAKGSSYVTVTGNFKIDTFPVPGLPMYVTLQFTTQPSEFCDSGTTDATGTATCTTTTSNEPQGTFVPVKVSFINNCQEYGTTTEFQVGNPVPPVISVANIPVQNGVCLLRTQAGDITVTAQYVSTTNTQPPITSPPVILGTFGQPTPTIATSTPTTPGTPVPTNTAVATPTNTLVPTPTNTPTNTPLPTSTPTNTPVPTLKFSLDAARVANPKNNGNRQGLDAVRQSQKVWLMIYYTIKSVPKTLNRVTTYRIQQGNRTFFKATFKGGPNNTVGPSDVGSFIRFVSLTFPRNFPSGVYVFKATLTIGNQSRTRAWRFAVIKRIVVSARLFDVAVSEPGPVAVAGNNGARCLDCGLDHGQY